MVDVTGSLNLTQTPPEDRPDDQVVPMLAGKMDPDEVKANFNALLYLMTEQMAVQQKLIHLLVEKEIITADEVNGQILEVTGNKEALTGVYNEMFVRFIGYCDAIRQMFKDGKVFKEGEGHDT